MIEDTERMPVGGVVNACWTSVMFHRTKAGMSSNISQNNIMMTRKWKMAELNCAAE
jgi:hypothetical protein